MRKPAADGNPIVIRPAHTDEAAAIAALIHRAFAHYRGRLLPESSALSENALQIASVIEVGTVLVAIRDRQLVGCVAVQRKADFAYAGRLAVDPGARGAGIGTALMIEAEAMARATGANRLRVDVRLALIENRAFFRALEFVEGAHLSHPGFAEPTYVELEKILV